MSDVMADVVRNLKARIEQQGLSPKIQAFWDKWGESLSKKGVYPPKYYKKPKED